MGAASKRKEEGFSTKDWSKADRPPAKIKNKDIVMKETRLAKAQKSVRRGRKKSQNLQATVGVAASERDLIFLAKTSEGINQET